MAVEHYIYCSIKPSRQGVCRSQHRDQGLLQIQDQINMGLQTSDDPDTD